MTEEWTPTEFDEDVEVVIEERMTLADGRVMVLNIEDRIVTMTHPLTGHTMTGPMTWVGKEFARLDLVVGHIKMADQIQAGMQRATDYEDENIDEDE